MKNNIISNIHQYISQNKIKHIYVDMDGVLIHSCQAICDMINEMQDTNFTGDEVLSWNFKEICPTLTDKDVEDLFADPIFFQYVEWIDGALEFIKHYENNVTIITKGTHENKNLKLKWLESYNLKDKVNFMGLDLDKSKGVINMLDCLFIDDCTNNLNETNATYKILFKEYNDNREREWQKNWNGLIMYNWK